MSRRMIFGIGACVLLLGGVGVLVYLAALRQRAAPGIPERKGPAASADDEKADGAPAGRVDHQLYIGRREGPGTPRVHTILTTRQGETTYQALVRYEPRPAPVSDVPGLLEVLGALAERGQRLPQHVFRIDQETETLLDNLGQSFRSVTSAHLFLNPADGKVIAYDLANSTGGQAQRFVGHLTRAGVTVEVCRGGEQVDRHELPFASRETFIPVEMEFIHQWYQSNVEAQQKREPVRFSVFIPEVLSFVWLVARPLGDQVIPVRDANHECTRYDVRTISTQVEGLQARQEMWFDKRSGLLMRREDFESALGPGDAPVTERANSRQLALVRARVVRPPELPEKTFPYQLGQDLAYHVRIGTGALGTLGFQFGRAPGAAEEFSARAKVNLEARGALRHEAAETRFDRHWRPVYYRAEGDEAADAKARYKVEAKVGHGQVEVAIEREVEEFAAPAPAPAPGRPAASLETAGWQDPLRRVPVNEEEAKAQEQAGAAPRTTRQALTRALSPGTFLFDFNRLEHLAVIAYRLPLPAPPAATKTDDGQPPVAYQKAALYSVRQNSSGVVLFGIRPEPRTALTERQRRLEAAQGVEEPQLYVATATSPLLPCRMLLAPDGRLLELALKHGNQEVVYTLDDPIMRRRAERAKKQRLLEGPQLIRPPWW